MNWCTTLAKRPDDRVSYFGLSYSSHSGIVNNQWQFISESLFLLPLSLPSGNSGGWYLKIFCSKFYRYFIFYCIIGSTGQSAHTALIQRLPHNDAFTKKESTNTESVKRVILSFPATKIITPNDVLSLRINLIVISMAEGSDVLHTGSQISPKDLLQRGTLHQYLFLQD